MRFMLNSEIQNRILQYNPWITQPDQADALIRRYLPETYVLREAEPVNLHNDRALLIVGPRQSGKSTLAWHLLLSYAPNILYFNLEDPLLRSAFGAAIELVSLLRDQFPFIRVVFLDEAQHLTDAGLFIKGLVDARLNIPILATGSSSFHLMGKTRESLAGRADRLRLLPFSLKELLRQENPVNPISARILCEKIFSRQMVYGSYPAVYLARADSDRFRLLSDLTGALILRDASDLFRIKRVDVFRKLLTLLAGQTGNLINFSELASICHVDAATIHSYVEILEESHVVKLVRPFAGGKRRELTSASKIYFIDNGIRNQLLNAFSTDISLRTDKGALMENWVFSELYKLLPLSSVVHFWRSKAGGEVDFVVEHAGKLMAIEVKSADLDRPRLSRSGRSFIDAYRPEKFLVLNRSLETTLTIDNYRIDFQTPYEMLGIAK
ncbi:MAG: ATP-binding protein [Deltaproteobacteria bacterium]|nr:ATP-binding protein [Deltaproteobacteria bacterium]